MGTLSSGIAANDYQTVDLAASCNVGADVLRGVRPFERGQRTYYGLLFDAQHANYMLTLVEGSLAYIRHRAVRADDRLPALERPFLEAKARLQDRMARETG